MSREAMEAVQDHSTITDPMGRNVFGAIARYVGPQNQPGWASYRTVAEKANCDKNTVMAWVGKLEEIGELTTRKEGSGRGTRIYYTINLPFNSDNNSGMYEPSSDNNHSDNNGGLSEQVKRLSEIVGILSEQVGLLSERLSENVLIHIQTETRNPLETKETGGEKPAPAPDVAVLGFLKANNINEPETADEWETIKSPEAITWLVATGYWPGYVALSQLRGRLGGEPSVDCLKQAWQLWGLSGYKKNNILGVVDWYGQIKANPDWKPGDKFKVTPNGHHPHKTPVPSQGLKEIEPGVY